MRAIAIFALMFQAPPGPVEPPTLLETWLKVQHGSDEVGFIHETVQRTKDGATYSREVQIRDESITIHALLDNQLRPLTFSSSIRTDGVEQNVDLDRVDVCPDPVLAIFSARKYGVEVEYRDTPWGRRPMSRVAIGDRVGYVDRFGRVVEMDLGRGMRAFIVKSESDIDREFLRRGARDSGCRWTNKR